MATFDVEWWSGLLIFEHPDYAEYQFRYVPPNASLEVFIIQNEDWISIKSLLIETNDIEDTIMRFLMR